MWTAFFGLITAVDFTEDVDEVNYAIVFESVLLIGMMILVGVILSYLNPLNEQNKQTYSMIIVNVAMPCIILSSIFKVDINQAMLRNILIVFILSLAINLFGIGLGGLLVTLCSPGNSFRREISLLSGLGNTGFIGIPLCATLLGPEGAMYAAIFDAGMDMVIWTVGVMILQKSKSFSMSSIKSMVNMPTLAIGFGLIFAFAKYHPPHIFVSLTNQLAALASPLAMFYIGLLIMSITKSQFQTAKSKIVIPVVSKLVILPLFVLMVIKMMNMDGIVAETLLIQAMMPVLTLASILFSRYGANDKLGAITTIITTIISMISIPLFLYILTRFHYL
ncbi:AEC family transporter [Peribacillus sp. SI8-4]|uniref:AEC family transporter n=1 Tax=Peribacillus sp. SI8-4 TaxID=3048009 RepID=UPI002555CA35|nr:AEC family transporter [Peribacillus sp. SI8-4]